jgi:hypothetical protein
MDNKVHPPLKGRTMTRLFATTLAATFAVAAIAFAGPAAADDITVDQTHFVSSKTRAEVTAEYLASRNATAALTREDSGSAYIAQRRQAEKTAVVAGRPINAQ